MRGLLLAAPLLAAPLAAVLALLPVSGHAQIVEDPCAQAPARPQAVTDYFAGALIFRNGKPLAAPPPEAVAYKAALERHKAQDWPNLCQYRRDNQRLAALPPASRAIVYIGDSITELWGIADPAFFTGGRINRGISGQTTAQMLLRFQADVIALHPREVHILGGTNDIAGNTGPQTMQDVHDNIAAMVSLAKAHGIRVVLGAVPPAARFAWRPELAPAPQVRALNTWLRAFSHQQKITFVDYYTPLANAEGGMKDGSSEDGVHPNAAGYRLMATAIRR